MVDCDNLFMVTGILGADPEMKDSKVGLVAKLRLAVKRPTGAKETDWFSCTMFGKGAELAQEYLKKGSRVSMVGAIRTDEYTDKNGEVRKGISVIVDSFRMRDGKREDNGSSPVSKPVSKAVVDTEWGDDVSPF